MQKTRHTLSIVKNSSRVAVPLCRSAMKPALTRLSSLLILDRYGCIRFCGRDIAALAGVASQFPTGQPVKSLLPAMPLHANTPGYNIAFAVFQASAGRRPLFQLKTTDSATVTVIVSLAVLETMPEYLIALEIREHASVPVIAPDTLASHRQQAIFHRCA